MNPFAHFEGVLVINLPHKIGRRERVMERLAEIGADVKRLIFIDGVRPQDVKVPSWWTDKWTMNGNGKTHDCRLPVGAYGALCAHKNALEYAIQNSIDPVLILEDDAVFCHGFAKRLLVFMDMVPTNWDCVHLRSTLVSGLCEFENVSTGIVRLLKGWSQVAVGYREKYRHVAVQALHGQQHFSPPMSLDYRLSLLHRDYNVYAADPALVGHESIDSDVHGGVRVVKQESCVDDVSGWSASRDGTVSRGDLIRARTAAFGPA